MIAVDTNLLVAILAADYPGQVAVVWRVIARFTVFIARTVRPELRVEDA